MTSKGSLQVSIAIVKAFLRQNFLSAVKILSQFSVFFGGKRSRNFVFGTPERHILARKDVI